MSCNAITMPIFFNVCGMSVAQAPIKKQLIKEYPLYFWIERERERKKVLLNEEL